MAGSAFTLKSFRKQFESTTEAVTPVKLGKHLRLSTHHRKLLFFFLFSFCLNILKFKLKYERTPQQIFFCWHRALKLFCHNVEADHSIKCSEKELDHNV